MNFNDTSLLLPSDMCAAVPPLQPQQEFDSNHAHHHHHHDHHGHPTPVMSRHHLMVAGGKMVPILQRFIITTTDLHMIMNRLSELLHPGDFILLLLIGWGTVPFMRWMFHRLCNDRTITTTPSTTTTTTKTKTTTNNTSEHIRSSDGGGGGGGRVGIVSSYSRRGSSFQEPLPEGSAALMTFEHSYMYQIAIHIQQAARLGIIVYIADCWMVILSLIGFAFTHLHDTSRAFCKILYMCWMAHRISACKRYYLGQAVSHRPDRLGRYTVLDRLLDGALFIVTSTFLLDILNVEMGVGVTSVFAFGSAGTLVFGLASRDVAAMLVNGLALSTSDRVLEGDDVVFGDGTAGKILKMGWTHTMIRHYDEKIQTVPNSELGMQRVINMSRVKQCRVKQTLRFRYEDSKKLRSVLASILEEIAKDCPDLIRDGSRPYRAVWTNYKEDYLEADIDVHFNLPSMGDAYWNNRMKVLEAIDRAVEQHDVQFVTTYYPQPQSSIMNAN